MRRVFKVLCVVAAVLGIVQVAHARGKLTTSYKYYTVSGSNAATLHSRMTVPTGFFSSERVYANITMHPSFSGKFKQGKRCRIKGFGINSRFVIRLPKLKAGSKLPRGLTRKFRRFVAYVKKHELTHRRIWTGCLRRAESRIRTLRVKQCGALDRQAAKIIRVEMDKCRASNARFDKAERKRLRRQPLVRAALSRKKNSKRAIRKTVVKRTKSRSSRSVGNWN